ncbi:hypothetical protein [Actinoplanes regularis]|uniref:hypothetical protein n=1 Tax=Actinoplanes regularis TaxID=52697 RepID=UPI0024A5D732|nr:hypothetical protein [Actinoplanes regularis]GLW33087.1 hypothetical protein Areg01_60250 [Actinoplanes regularis]
MERKGESQRKPIEFGLPGDVQALLARMEQLADAKKLSFTKIAAGSSADGEKIQAVHVRRWRSGDGFPSEPAVRRWIEICDGDVPEVMATAAPAPSAADGTQLPFMYKVPSGAGSTDVVMTKGGSVVQPFRATAARIDQVGAIVGIDPARGDVRAPHPVRFEVLQHVKGDRPVLLGWAAAAVTPENNNKDVIGEFRPRVVVTPGQIYALRVINQSGPVGVYVNSPAGVGRTVPYVADVCATEPLEPFEPAGRVLAGFVSATT